MILHLYDFHDAGWNCSPVMKVEFTVKFVLESGKFGMNKSVPLYIRWP